MTDKIEGFLEVGLNDRDEIVVNHPDLKPDETGAGHIVFSADQALNLADLLFKKAHESRANTRQKSEELRRAKAAEIPVNRAARELTDGSPVTDDHREINPLTGQQKGYVVLSAEERGKGFVRPVRRSYTHTPCGAVTTMGNALAETYARDPSFYSGTFCCRCHNHFSLNEFVWEGTSEQVGS